MKEPDLAKREQTFVDWRADIRRRLAASRQKQIVAMAVEG